MSKKYTPFKMKGFPQQAGVSPAKHSSNRIAFEGGGNNTHNDMYDTFNSDTGERTKKHTNEDHPDYWKVKEHEITTSKANPDYDMKKAYEYLDEDGELSNWSGDMTRLNPDYDPDAPTNERTTTGTKKIYLSDKDMEIQQTRAEAEGKYADTDFDYWEDEETEIPFVSTSTKDRVGKTGRNVYKTKTKAEYESDASDASDASVTGAETGAVTGAETEPKKKVNLLQKIAGGIQKEIRRALSAPKRPKASDYKWKSAGGGTGGWKHGGEAKYKKAMEEYSSKKLEEQQT